MATQEQFEQAVRQLNRPGGLAYGVSSDPGNGEMTVCVIDTRIQKKGLSPAMKYSFGIKEIEALVDEQIKDYIAGRLCGVETDIRDGMESEGGVKNPAESET